MTSVPIHYGKQPPPAPLRYLLRPVLGIVALLATIVIFWFATVAYVDRQYRGLVAGMTRVQVDQKLWAFRSYPFPPYRAGPGEFVIRYELFRFGKDTTIQIVFRTDGTVAEAHPVYDN